MSTQLSGRVALVTGANNGLGLQAAGELAKMGAHVVMACRSLERGQAAMDGLLAQDPALELSLVQLDVVDPASVQAMAQTIEREHGALHVLLNNAGIQSNERHTTAAGIERVFDTNVLGYFRVSAALEPLLRASAPARVVNVASSYAGDVDLDDLQFTRRPYKSTSAYRQSKACNRMLTRARARRLEGSGVTVNSAAPGMVLATGIYDDIPWMMRKFLGLINLFAGSKTIADGADTAVWLASSPELEGRSGLLFEERTEIACAFTDTANEERLWGQCQALTAT